MPQSLLTYLFAPRVASRPAHAGLPKSRFETGDAVVLLLYSVALVYGIVHHVPWVDEAQAWLIARDASLHALLVRSLHYEGAPVLWYLLLKMAIGAHMPYAAFNWFGGIFAVAGIWFFLRFSPFPRIFRWLVPFTFFLQFQYAVVARPYVLCPLLIFALCATFTLAKPRPLLFATVAGLLANINAHTAILSCVFAALYLGERWRTGSLKVPSQRREVLWATLLFVGFCLASILVAFPAPDATVIPTATGVVKKSNPLLVRLIPPERLPPHAPPLDLDLEPSTGAAGSPGQAMVEKHKSFVRRIGHKVRGTVEVAADIVTFPVAESNLVALALLCALAIWLWSRHALRFLLPWLITVPAAAYIWVFDHHTGILLLALLSAGWLALCTTPGAARGPRWSAPAFISLALLVLVLQVGWSAHALLAQARSPYDGGKQTAAFLATYEQGKRIVASNFEAVSVQPYAAKNEFFNWDHSFWIWSNAAPVNLRLTEAWQEHPDVVLIGDLVFEHDTLMNQWVQHYVPGNHPSAFTLNFWRTHGYQETHSFCGNREMRAGYDDEVCERIFEPAPTGGLQNNGQAVRGR